MHVLGARVGRSDATRLWSGVPVVDDVVVLDSRVRTSPSCLRDLVEKLSCVNFFYNLTIASSSQSELAATFDSVHKLCVYPN